MWMEKTQFKECDGSGYWMAASFVIMVVNRAIILERIADVVGSNPFIMDTCPK